MPLRQGTLATHEKYATDAESLDRVEAARARFETATKDIEAGISNANISIDAATTEESPTHHCLCGPITFLFTVLVVIPGLLFIALPSLFIIAGKHHRIADDFTFAYCTSVGATLSIYAHMLCIQCRKQDSLAEALLESLWFISVVLGSLIGLGFALRVAYWIVTCIWWLVGDVVLAIWGGRALLSGTGES